MSDNKCAHCKEVGAYSSPDDDGHWAGQVTISVGPNREGAITADIYPHIFFNNCYLCEPCKEELAAKIILELAEAIENIPDMLFVQEEDDNR